jgi:glycosyltransferase involved in cell wall biosynthesis
MKVLIVYSTSRPFIDLDVALLRSAFDVRTAEIDYAPRHDYVASTLRAVRDVAWADVVVSWFGVLHALVPFAAARLFGTPRVVIASGVDVAAMPALGYGHMRGGWLRAVGRTVFRLADRVLAVSRHTAQEAQRNAGVPASKVGVVYHGIPARCTRPLSSGRAGVLTVATANDITLQRKGLRTFVRTARLLPGVPFRIVGGGTPAALQTLRRAAPPNVTFTGWVPYSEIHALMRRAKVYAQLSAYESFGMALAEAMQCGCVPVVTRRGALPEVVGATGHYVPYAAPRATAAALRQALAAPPSAGRRAQERIRHRFPLARRRDQLASALRQTVAGPGSA